jgi:hypothetical protein
MLPLNAQASGFFYVSPPVLEKPIPAGTVTWIARTTGSAWAGVDGAGHDFEVAELFVPLGYGVPTLVASYDASREMAEVVEFTITTAMQSVITLPDDQEVQAIEINANKVSDATRDASIPIVDVRRRSYCHTTRGEQSIQHLILVARAHLVSKARAIQVSFDCPFLDGLEITLRKNVLIHDPRFPGGQALGKVMSYSFTMDGETGTSNAKITFGCAVGYGGSYTEAPGDPTYVEDGYVEDGYQARENVVTLIDTGDLTYTMPAPAEFDDGIDFVAGMTPTKVVHSLSITNGPSDQRTLLVDTLLGTDDPIDFRSKYFWTYDEGSNWSGVSRGQYQTPKPDLAEDFDNSYQHIPTTDVVKQLEEIPTRVSLTMVPLTGGPFIGEVVVGVSDLIVPKQIDLEAPSA